MDFVILQGPTTAIMADGEAKGSGVSKTTTQYIAALAGNDCQHIDTYEASQMRL